MPVGNRRYCLPQRDSDVAFVPRGRHVASVKGEMWREQSSLPRQY